MANKYYIGIDPDLTKQSLAMIEPTGNLVVLYAKTKEPTGTRSVAEIKLARTTENVRRIVSEIADMKIKGENFEIAIEHQNFEQAKREQKIRYQDLSNLAHVSGVWSGMISALLWVPHHQIHIVKANVWKGSQPKWINQRRTLEAFKIPYSKMGGKDPYPVPSQYEISKMCLDHSPITPNPGDFKDINDSIGLALYLHKKYNK